MNLPFRCQSPRIKNPPLCSTLNINFTMLHKALLLTLCGLPYITASPIHKRAFPNPEPCLGNCSWVHDPSVIVKDGTYYRFSTSGNIAIATAPSLTGPWEYKGSLLGPNGSSIHVIDGQDVWVRSSFLFLHTPLHHCLLVTRAALYYLRWKIIPSHSLLCRIQHPVRVN